MSLPQYTIKIYDYTVSSLKYTITKDAQTQTHMGMNDDLGNFQITLPAINGLTAVYPNIAVGDVVKVWIGYDATHATGDPDFRGKIYQITGSLSEKAAYTKTVTGRSCNEVLQRRIKSRTVWTETSVKDIVLELAEDLNLYTNYVANDTTPVNITSDQETYMDILRKVSDYWTSTAEVKKDFWIEEVSGNLELIWAARPRRTAGVETLTEKDNILGYSVTKDLTGLKNAVGVYGALTPFNASDVSIYGRKYPQDGDPLNTEFAATWGTVTSNSTSPKVGSTCTRFTSVAGDHSSEIDASWVLTTAISVEGLNGYSVLDFYARRHDTGEGLIRLYAPDGSNYFYLDSVSFSDSNDVWKYHRYSLGKSNEYDADSNPEGWHVVGSPTWESINYVNFYCPTCAGAGSTIDVDGLCFNFGRWRYSPAADVDSINAYEEFDMVLNDNNLTSDAMCESKAETVLYQNKTPVTRIDAIIKGNTNVLLGDRLAITLPYEAITAQNYYVTGVDHAVTDAGFKSKPIMLNSTDSRIVPGVSRDEVLIKSIKNLQQMSRNQKRVN